MHSVQANAEQIKSFRLSSKRFRKFVDFLNDLERFVLCFWRRTRPDDILKLLRIEFKFADYATIKPFGRAQVVQIMVILSHKRN